MPPVWGLGEGVDEAETTEYKNTEYKIKLNCNEGLGFDLLCSARERKIFSAGVPVSSFLLGCRSCKERWNLGRKQFLCRRGLAGRLCLG